jgi:hypothetical protein
VRASAAAPQKESRRQSQAVKLPLDAAQAEKYAALSAALEARLSALSKQLPDDGELPTIDIASWDDEELLKEGRELRKSDDGVRQVLSRGSTEP